MSQPIILIGAARSGTKFLRDVLASSNQAKCVPYDVNYVWRFGNEKHDDDALPLEKLDDRKRQFIRKTLKSLAKIASDDEQTVMVEKTVSNTLRLPYVHAVYPNARYIHLIRDGRAVTESAMRLWQAPPDWGALLKKLREMPLSNFDYAFWFATNQIKGLFSKKDGGKVWGPRYVGIDEDVANLPLLDVCSLQWVNCVTSTLDALADIPPEQVKTIRYEDLVRDEQALRDLCDFLGLSDTETVISSFKARVKLGQNDKWMEKISDDDRARMTDIMHDGLDRLGFLKGE